MDATLWRRIAGLLALALFALLMWRATWQENAVTCEICMDFAGRSACREASGRDRDAAVYAARTAACAVLASGVTAGMQCDRTPPRSLQCDE